MCSSVSAEQSWQIDILVQSEKTPINTERVEALLSQILEFLAEKHPEIIARELSVVLCDDAYIQELNKLYRDKDYPTDVLSFSQLEGEVEVPSSALGDVVVSLRAARRQAKQYKVTLDQELNRLLIHGVLHLFGYEHENVPKETEQEMQELEDFLISNFVKA